MEREQPTEVEVMDWNGALHPAPDDFVRQLREDTDTERLEVFWDPGEPLKNNAHHPLEGDNAPHPEPFDADHGCWTVFMRVRGPMTTTDVAGNDIVFSDDDILVPVLSLDGLQNFGMPCGLGAHVGVMLNYSDVIHRGFPVYKAKADAHRADYAREWARQESVTSAVGNDKHIARGYRRLREQMGVTQTTEQKREEATKYERRYNLMKSRQQSDMKEMGL